MIKSLRLKNFKAFEDTGVIQFKPMTVLAGPNSGGKSSILQSLLLLKQTLEGPPELDLNLEGRYMQFSGFNELTFGKPPLSSCEVTFEFETERAMPRDVAPMYFPTSVLPEESENVPLHGKVELSFRYKKRDDRPSVVLNQFRISSELLGDKGPRIEGKLRGSNYQVSMSGEGLRLSDQFKDRKIRTVHGPYFMPLFLVFEEDQNDTSHSHASLNQIFRNLLSDLQHDIEDNLKYLGPLRERPRRGYLHSGNNMIEIGESGQYAAQILWLEKDRKISYLSDVGGEPERVTLMEAVNDAFIKLGMHQTVNVKSEGSVMYQILFPIGGPTSRKAVTIADVGFGVSQILPILVLGLRSSSSSLLFFEQPEIHLHPKVQANLADFLLTLAKQDRQMVIETHSDHFINRLRRRIAEDPTDELREKVSILFVQPPHDGQGASIEPLQMDRFGIIENWPPDFLPEAADEAEAIFLAGLNKRGG